jgi:TraM recognition site of TraD and TraG
MAYPEKPSKSACPFEKIMNLDNPILARLLCFEPAGKVIELSCQTVLKHILATGSTGSGKTSSVIDPCLEQFVKFGGGNPTKKLGLLILDPKGDSAFKVSECAKGANREQDLVILGKSSHYDLFADLVNLDQIDHFTEQLMSGSADMGPLNAYWEEARRGFVSSSLFLLLAQGGSISYAQASAFLSSCWLPAEINPLVEKKLTFARALLRVGRLSQAAKRRLELAIRDIEQWFRLDSRLRESHRSSLMNILRPLLDPRAQRLFEGQGRIFSPRDVLDGRILLVSVDAQVSPRLASLVFRMVKRDFFSAIHSRRAVDLDRDRLCILVADEYYLAAEPEDIENLATCRSRGAAVLAATQGLSALDEKLGRRKRDALLGNFGSMFFFCNRERAADEEAFLRMGFQEPSAKTPSAPVFGPVDVIDSGPVPGRAPVCEPGSLSRLVSHEAFVILADGTRTTAPVWLEPKFHPIPEPPPRHSQPDEFRREARRLRAAVMLDDLAQSANQHLLLGQMHQRGRRLWLTPPILESLWPLCQPKQPREQLLEVLATKWDVSAGKDFPSCWLVGLVALLQERPALGGMLLGIDAVQGVLWMSLSERAPDSPEYVEWHELANLWIYPSLWKPARRTHLCLLWARFPHLRSHLRSLPQPGSRNGALPWPAPGL